MVLALVGVIIHFAGSHVIYAVLPPVVTGAVVMLIGFNLAPVVAKIYWPQDQWIALIVMAAVIGMTVGFRGFFGRIAIFLGLLVGYVLSWVFDRVFGQITSFDAAAGEVTTHFRVNWERRRRRGLVRLPAEDAARRRQGVDRRLAHPRHQVDVRAARAPGRHRPHRREHRARQGRRRDDQHRPRPDDGRAIAADGVGTIIASSVGGSPTTTYAENIGVMAATRVYSTAAYFVAAGVAIIFGLSPKFGAVISATPGGVLGGITVVLYGMIGLLGAKIWKENRVDFANPVNLVPVAAGIIIAIGDTSLTFTDSFSLSGIALGTIVTIVGWHAARWLAPRAPRRVGGPVAATVTEPGVYASPNPYPETSEQGDTGSRARTSGAARHT